MKRIICSIACMVALNSANAATYTFSGKVTFLRTHDSHFGTNYDWFSLDTFTPTSVPTCPGNLARIKDDIKGQRMYKVLLTAKMLQTSVQISLDDAFKDTSGYCFLQYIDT